MPKNKKDMNRLLSALDIAKVLFWADGYHLKYLEQIEVIIKEYFSVKIAEKTHCRRTP